MSPLGRLIDVPCLVLLGEAGLGKSRAVRQEADRLQAVGERVALVDLATISSDQGLRDATVHSDAFRQWHAGDHVLHVFVDALDECVGRVPRAATMVADELAGMGTDRLRLRIVSRPSAWDRSIDDRLRGHWGSESVASRVLAPLRRVDVESGAEVNGLDAPAFLEAVDEAGAVAFARVPLTLEMLFTLFDRGELHRTSRWRLFADQCRVLLEEGDFERRQEQLARGLPDADERVAIAARIAAATTLTGRSRVWPGRQDDPHALEDAVSVAELVGGSERIPRPAAPDGSADVSRPGLLLALDTPLFRDAGDGCRRWTHASYAEFLTARYLTQRGLSADEMARVLLQRDEAGDLRVAPQSLEIAGWIASMRSDVLDLLIKTDPEALLQSDAVDADDLQRARLVAQLLTWFDEGRLYNVYRVRVRGVGYPGLGDTLRPWIAGRDRWVEARRLAVRIAEENGVASVAADLVEVAVDAAEWLPLRRDAIRAVATLGSDSDRLRLRSLALDGGPGDEDHELRGAALSALWPAHLNAEELFANLVPPPRLFGAYRRFLFYELVPGLTDGDLPHALRWVSRLPQMAGAVSAFDHVVDAVLARALTCSETSLPARFVGEAFAAIYLSRETYRQDSPNRVLLEALDDADVRRRLLREVVPMLGESDGLVWLRMSRPGVLRSDDFLWVLEQLRGMTDDGIAATWAKVGAYAFDRSRFEHVDAVLTLASSSAALAKEFAPMLGSVELGSEEALGLREDWEQGHRREVRDEASEEGPDPAMRQRVEAKLHQAEGSDPAAWWEVDLLLQFDDSGHRETHEHEDDITRYPGWQSADIALQDRFLAASMRFLEAESPTIIEAGRLHRPTAAGFRALMLLQRQRPMELQRMSEDAWRRWAPTVVSFPYFSQDRDTWRELVAAALSHASAEFRSAMSSRIDQELARGEGRCPALILIADVMDSHLEAIILRKLTTASLTPRGTRDLLRFLLSRANREAFAHAELLVGRSAPGNGDPSEQGVVAGALLLRYPDRPEWDTLWERFLADREFGIRVIFALVGEDYEGLPHARFSEGQLARLYKWLVEQFPSEEDPDTDGYVDARTEVSWLRNGVLTALIQRGTPDAAREVASIVQAFPQYPWLQRALIDARGAAREKSWTPMTLDDVLALGPRSIVVRSGDDLARAIADELELVQRELRGKTPAARDLWDRIAEGTYRPIRELEMSDWIARRLKSGAERPRDRCQPRGRDHASP